MTDRVFTDESIARAVDYLTTSAGPIGAARSRMVKARHMVDHIDALMTASSRKLDWDTRRAEARGSERYHQAITEHADATGDFEVLKSLREAASATIQAWQTESSNYRGIKI